MRWPPAACRSRAVGFTAKARGSSPATSSSVASLRAWGGFGRPGHFLWRGAWRRSCRRSNRPTSTYSGSRAKIRSARKRSRPTWWPQEIATHSSRPSKPTRQRSSKTCASNSCLSRGTGRERSRASSRPPISSRATATDRPLCPSCSDERSSGRSWSGAPSGGLPPRGSRRSSSSPSSMETVALSFPSANTGACSPLHPSCPRGVRSARRAQVTRRGSRSCSTPMRRNCERPGSSKSARADEGNSASIGSSNDACSAGL